jgi:hypothetical protein
MRSFAIAILLMASKNTDALASTITIDFNGLPGGSQSDNVSFASYTESGFTVSSTSGSWKAITTFGDPAPFIQFTSTGPGIFTSSVVVTEQGSSFSFNSVDLYSSVTPIPYTFTGFLLQMEVFSVSGIVPNTFGTFAEASNPDSTALIDTLEITLTNPGPFSNPVGLDNIVLTTVPEPASWSLVGTVLALVFRATKGKLSRNFTAR